VVVVVLVVDLVDAVDSVVVGVYDVDAGGDDDDVGGDDDDAAAAPEKGSEFESVILNPLCFNMLAPKT
jgi:hypothetical protein